MRNLWNPWREEHVLGRAEKADYCIFEPPTTASHSKEHLLLYRDSTVVILLNRFPYANGHLLLAPLRHVADLTELEPAESQALMELTTVCTAILRSELHCDGLNIGCNLGEVAGAGIASHLHIHIVPRWEGDHNFMTVVSEIRTIPIHIANTFDQLLPAFQQLYQIRNPATSNTSI